jgi:hypothetical protein
MPAACGFTEDKAVAVALELIEEGLAMIELSRGAGPNGEDVYELLPAGVEAPWHSRVLH